MKVNAPEVDFLHLSTKCTDVWQMLSIHSMNFSFFHKMTERRKKSGSAQNRNSNTEIESCNYRSPETSNKINDNSPAREQKKNTHPLHVQQLNYDQPKKKKKPPKKNVRKLVELLVYLVDG